MWLLLPVLAHAADCPVEVESDRIPAAEAQLGFAPRTAEPTPESGPALDGVACLLAAEPALTVQIEVHTDSRGSGAYNLRISQDRADALRAALIERGADADRVTAVGYGELHPLDAGSDRRIELHTTPPSERPPRPEAPEPPVPSPAPRPAPEPVVDLCAEARVLRADVVPSWPGASCSGTADAWRCVVPTRFETLAATLEGCLEGAQRDGDELFVPLNGATIRFAAEGDRTVVQP